jgi:hypothetical protein
MTPFAIGFNVVIFLSGSLYFCRWWQAVWTFGQL